jgi:hypothetical protein
MFRNSTAVYAIDCFYHSITGPRMNE